MNSDPVIRLQLRCRGTVQGVGFRPAIHRLATSAGIFGWVINDPQGATMEIEGPTSVVESFAGRLENELPPLARLDAVEREVVEPEGAVEFEVRTSTMGRREGALVPPDAVLCEDCRREMGTPDDRRYHYPFTTCTNCGPRFSLVHQLPYDRERTSMACFPFCEDCRREYEDPSDRRFHAEPVACPACGPRLWLADENGQEVASAAEALARAREELKNGRIGAIKGLGGFQLACRADSPEAVARLRKRKRRFGKPFAVMVRDLKTARLAVTLDADAERLLTSPRAPIVLGTRTESAAIAEVVAPGLEDLGVMLPTTPLHVEVFRDPEMPPLVMTSGNLTEEPLCRSNRGAVSSLAGIADFFLLHDRDIVRRIDDSVVRTSPSGPMIVRRARGWVPEPVNLPEKSPVPVVATGGHLQVTACVAQGDQAFPSQHVGDLDSIPARAFLREVIDGLLDFLQLEPGLVAVDAHPDYPSTWLGAELATEFGVEVVSIQHHLAHVAAVLAEQGSFPEPDQVRLGIALDGTGWGPDNTAWGGEWILIGGDLMWRRVAHLEALPLIGGEQAVLEPWRVAIAALAGEGALDLVPRTPMAATVEDDRLEVVSRLAEKSVWPRASGAGRVFEAAGALLGVGSVNRWEGEAAARLEALATRAPGPGRPWKIDLIDHSSDPILRSGLLLTEAARRAADGENVETVAADFHATFCAAAAEITNRVAPEENCAVALGGGCMVNRVLGSHLRHDLEERGFEPLFPKQLPPGDGGLSYGQAAVAAVAAARGKKVRMLDVLPEDHHWGI